MSNNPQDRELYYNEPCDKNCENLQQKLVSLRDELVTQVNMSLSLRNRQANQDTNQNTYGRMSPAGAKIC